MTAHRFTPTGRRIAPIGLVAVLLFFGLFAAGCSRHHVAATPSPAAAVSSPPAPVAPSAPLPGSTGAVAGRAQPTADVEADLSRATADLGAAGQDLVDGPTEAIVDPRG